MLKAVALRKSGGFTKSAKRLSLYLCAVLGAAASFFIASCGDSDDGVSTGTETKYTVTVIGGGAGSTGGGSYKESETVTITAGMAPTGKQFKNWTSASGVTFADSSSDTTSFIMPDNDVAVTANFEDISECTITYNGNNNTNGTAPADTNKYLIGAEVTVLSSGDLSKTNCTFSGWNTKADGSGSSYAAGNKFKITANVTLYARWTSASVSTYAVTVTGGTTSSVGGGDYAEGETVTITAGTAPAGKQFKNWTSASGVTFADSSSRTTTFTMPAKAVTVTAVFEALSIGLKAEPVAASNNPLEPKVIGSWRDIDANYYIIDLGYIRNALVDVLMYCHYNGITPIKKSITKVTTETLSSSVTQTVSSNIGFSLSSTVEFGIDLTSSIETQIFGLVKGGVSVSEKFKTSLTSGISVGQSKTTSTTAINTFTESLEEATEWTIGNNGEAAGHYRYVLYAVSDIYLLISTSLNNQTLISEEIISCGRTGTYTPYFEYSSDNKFDNAPVENKIELADGYYKNLPVPNVGRTKEYKKIEMDFTNTGAHSYTYVPSVDAIPIESAIVEIYALGGGGGGQGGGSVLTDILGIFGNVLHATGAGGGGGGAAYISDSIFNNTDFNINVGHGATGGQGVEDRWWGGDNDWMAGNNGKNIGGKTEIQWSNGKRLTAFGGQGGYGGRLYVSGGGGGRAEHVGGYNYVVDNGQNGRGGGFGDVGSFGGNAGKINNFGGGDGATRGRGVSNGGGGAGGYTHSQFGSSGGNGMAKIIITYPEIVEL